MICITSDPGRVTITGHGTDNPVGPSIACVGISTLTATLVNSLDVLVSSEAVSFQDDGQTVTSHMTIKIPKPAFLSGLFFWAVLMSGSSTPPL